MVRGVLVLPIVLLALAASCTVSAPVQGNGRTTPQPSQALGGADQEIRQEDEWYLQTEDKSSRLYIREFGRGDTVVVLHGGWGAEHSYLLDAVRGLEDQYHFVFYDQRGSLRSEAPDSTISVRQHVEDLEQLRRELGLERLDLLAHSVGTFLAMSYLERYPEYTGGLVLAGAIQPERETMDLLSEGAQEWFKRPAVAAELREEGLDKPREEMTQREITHAWRVEFAGVNLYHVDRWRQMKGGVAFYDAQAGQAAVRSMPKGWDFTDELAAHGSPIYVIMGDHDYVDLGPAAWPKVAQRLPNVHLRVLEQAGHAAWIDQPERFRASLREALEAITKE